MYLPVVIDSNIRMIACPNRGANVRIGPLGDLPIIIWDKQFGPSIRPQARKGAGSGQQPAEYGSSGAVPSRRALIKAK
jgi:hypothetical protein